MKIDVYRTRDKILEYYEQVLKKKQQAFTPNKEADSLSIISNAT